MPILRADRSLPHLRRDDRIMNLSNIRTVVASAGTGKTTHIVGRISEEVTARPPEEIVATTFTVKAADELIERSRARLFRDGAWDSAARLLGARFGTINSVCGQIVSEHAIALGRSPRADVIPEEGVARIFMIAANAAIERYAPALNRLADAMGASEPKRSAQDAERADWRTRVRRIIELDPTVSMPTGLQCPLIVLGRPSLPCFVRLRQVPPISMPRCWMRSPPR